MINKSEFRRRKTFEEALQDALYNKTKRTVILKKFKNSMPFLGMIHEIDLNNLINKAKYKYMSISKENKATQTDLPEDEVVQVETIKLTDEDKLSKVEFEAFNNELKNKSDAMVQVETKKMKPKINPPTKNDNDDYDDDDDDDEKRKLSLIEIIEIMIEQGINIADIIAHITYHTALTTIQISNLTGYILANSLFTAYDISNAIMNWMSNNEVEDVELNTSPPISVNSSPPITVNSSSSHTVNSSTSESPSDIPIPTDTETEEEASSSKEKEKSK